MSTTNLSSTVERERVRRTVAVRQKRFRRERGTCSPQKKGNIRATGRRFTDVANEQSRRGQGWTPLLPLRPEPGTKTGPPWYMAMVSSASPVPLSPIVLSKPSLDSEHVEAAGLLHLFAGGQASGLATEKPPPAVVRRQPPAPKPNPPPPQPPQPPPPERRKPEKNANPKRRYHSASYKLSVVREARPRPNLWAITPRPGRSRGPRPAAPGEAAPPTPRPPPPLAPPRPRPTLCLTSPTAASDMKPTPDRRCGGRSIAASSRRAATTPRSRRAACGRPHPRTASRRPHPHAACELLPSGWTNLHALPPTPLPPGVPAAQVDPAARADRGDGGR